MKIDNMIAVLQAAKEGKTIQFKRLGDKNWTCLPGDPVWDFGSNDYRAKPEPREFWINRYDEDFMAVHQTSAAAKANGRLTQKMEIIHVREVLE